MTVPSAIADEVFAAAAKGHWTPSPDGVGYLTSWVAADGHRYWVELVELDERECAVWICGVEVSGATPQAPFALEATPDQLRACQAALGLV
ncbi:hypothetical protein [Streptacidiphilus cavernicola]|uniref:Uncharacterized protein n=1 Tax=Streptacidiphilus cavernicola TaxID=3342716 RepID=A0ABV6VY63_9ACTN